MRDTSPLLSDAFATQYHVKREIGQGGMATVYLAEEQKHGRKVAIKVLRPALGEALDTERFLREVDIIAHLSHPHILPLIDSGEVQGLLYYVAPYVAGGSLADRLMRDRKLSIKDALRIAREAGSGLDYVHRSGFVHRDIKPENILFADGLALIADFGVALAFKAPGTVLTQVGVIIGTPEYMSPEQASGEQNLDSRSDLYSFACVIYEMLTGRPPFNHRSARIIMSKHVAETPPLLRTLRPDAPPAVEEALAKALAKDPRERYETVADFLDALEYEAGPSATNSHPPYATLFGELTELESRRGTQNVKAYGLYLKGRYAWNKRTQEGLAEAIQYFERAIAEDPNYSLAYAGLADSYALHVDYRSVPVREGFERAKSYARKAIELDETVAEAHASLAWSLFIYDWDWDGAGREFRRAIELEPRYASAHQWYAFLLASEGRADESIAEVRTALELDPASVSVRRSVAWAYYYARRYAEARLYAQRAIALNPTAEESYRVQALALAQTGDMAEAERVMREAIELPGAGPYASATLGYVLARAGKRLEAESLLEALESAAVHSYVSPVALAVLHIGLGNIDRALDCAERAYDERRGWLAYLHVNPMLNPLRDNPRFRALVQKMNVSVVVPGQTDRQRS